MTRIRYKVAGFAALLASTQGFAAPVAASDHLDAPTVIAEPESDIADLYAWMSKDGKRLNLIVTIFGKTFSPQIDYVVHIDSGRKFGKTTASLDLSCRIKSPEQADCALGDIDRAIGDASLEAGLTSRKGAFRVFAGPRDDPFFNNVRGTRDMYNGAIAAIKADGSVDRRGCPVFSPAVSRDLLGRWSRTEGGPGQNFLAGWAIGALVVSVDAERVSKGGKLLAIWSTTSGPQGGLDRMARPLTGNALLATLGPNDHGNGLKEGYNRAVPSTAARFAPEIAKGLAFYDGIDGECGNQWLIGQGAEADHYGPLSRLLADDRLWIDASERYCSSLFAVERLSLSGDRRFRKDCGGRRLDVDAVDIYRSLLVDGTSSSVNDGVAADDRTHSSDIFPFLAPADPAALEKKP